jgi:diadenosine tetraphosphate (Ap4A) HIT family hydrolase
VDVVGKEVALAQLAIHRERLLKDGASCVMCALAHGGADVPFIARNEHAVVLLDRFACRAGHLMIIPRRHVERLGDLPWEIFVDVQQLVYEASQAIDACLKPARVFTATLGAAVELPMTYSHHHVHVIPVYETDERARPARVLSWTEGVIVYDDAEARELSRRLMEHWPQRAGGL